MSTSDATGPSTAEAGELLSAETLRERAEAYAAVAAADTDLNRTTFVLFRLGGECFAIALDDLDEVACVETGIALANVDPTIIGLANLRGELLPLLDTAAMLGTRCEYRLGGDNRTLVIRDVYGRRSGLPVDRVDAVEYLDTGIFQLRAAAAEQRPIARAGVAEHAGAALSLLDVSGLRQGHVEHF
ncbi:MAG: chemotaxis protein CheW [Thiohalocapsa sp.]